MAVQPRNEPLIYTRDTRAQLIEDCEKKKGGKARIFKPAKKENLPTPIIASP